MSADLNQKWGTCSIKAKHSFLIHQKQPATILLKDLLKLYTSALDFHSMVYWKVYLETDTW